MFMDIAMLVENQVTGCGYQCGEGEEGSSGEKENTRSQVREHHQNLLEGGTEFQYPRESNACLDPDTWGSLCLLILPSTLASQSFLVNMGLEVSFKCPVSCGLRFYFYLLFKVRDMGS